MDYLPTWNTTTDWASREPDEAQSELNTPPEEVWSGRRDPNSRPLPWQGRHREAGSLEFGEA